MSILSRVKSVFSPPIKKALNLEQALRLWLNNIALKGDVKDGYRESAWVYACITTIANKIASVPFVITLRGQESDGGFVLASSAHPAVRTFASPNMVITPVELFQTIVIQMMTSGASLVLKEKNADGSLSLWPIDANRIASAIEVNGQLAGWKVKTKKGYAIFDSKAAVFLRLPDPVNPLAWIAPMDVVKSTTSQNVKAARYNESLLDNGSVPPGFITMPENVSLEEFERTKREWDEGHKGAEGAGRIGWLFGGMTYQSAGFSPKDMMLTELSKGTREEILAVFGVPPAEVGIFEFANYANAREQLKKLWGNRLIPLLVYLEQALNARLFRVDFPDVEGFFDLTNVEDLGETLSEKADVALKFFNMGIPFADVNEVLELPFNVSDKPWLLQGYLPLGIAPTTEAAMPTDNLTSPSAASSRQPLRSFTPETSIASRAFSADVEKSRRSRALYHRAFMRTIGAGIRRVRPRVRAHFHSEGESVIAAIERNYETLVARYGKDIASAVQKWKSMDKSGVADRYTEWRKFCEVNVKGFSDDVSKLIFSVDESSGRLIAATESETKRMLEQGAQITSASSGVDFTLGDDVVVKLLDKRKNLISDIGRETFLLIRENLQDSIRDGLSVEAAARRMRALYDDFERTRAITIAQTEMGFAFNAAANEFYESEGFSREWVSSGDADVRESHRIDGEVRRPNQRFSNGLLYPSEQGGAPGEVINCRCAVAPVPEARRSVAFRANGSYDRLIRRLDGTKCRVRFSKNDF